MTAEVKEPSTKEVAVRFNRWAKEQGRLGPDLWNVFAIEGSLLDVQETPESRERQEKLKLRAKQLDEEAKALGLTPVEYLKQRLLRKR